MRAAVLLALAISLGATPVAIANDRGRALLQQAEALEREGKGGDAVKAYVRAARAGSPRAARRLGEIYERGDIGVVRDCDQSKKWYLTAISNGDAMGARRPAPQPCP